MTRAESRAQTRQRLLDAAALCIAGEGLAATSVEDIAAQAGYTRGAFYSNFSSKCDVFVELLRLDHERFREELQAMIDGTPSNEDVQTQFASWLDRCYRDDTHYVLWAEARLHATRDVKFRQHLNAMCIERRDTAAHFIEHLCGHSNTTLAGSSVDHALVAIIVMDGVRNFKLMSPVEVSYTSVDTILSDVLVSLVFRRSF